MIVPSPGGCITFTARWMAVGSPIYWRSTWCSAICILRRLSSWLPSLPDCFAQAARTLSGLAVDRWAIYQPSRRLDICQPRMPDFQPLRARNSAVEFKIAPVGRQILARSIRTVTNPPKPFVSMPAIINSTVACCAIPPCLGQAARATVTPERPFFFPTRAWHIMAASTIVMLPRQRNVRASQHELGRRASGNP